MACYAQNVVLINLYLHIVQHDDQQYDDQKYSSIIGLRMKGKVFPMNSMNKFNAGKRSSRRSILKKVAVGTASVAAITGISAGGYMLANGGIGSAHANADLPPPLQAEPIQTILNIAATAESLAVVFYSQVLLNASGSWGWREVDPAFLDIKAALIEEQLHLNFLLAQKAVPLTKTFSFPFGAGTFIDFNKFIKTQQFLETVFVAAYILAGKEFAQLARPDLVQIAGQIGTVEAEHRAIGRAIGALRPSNNVAFSPLTINVGDFGFPGVNLKNVTLNMVGDAATLLKNTGFLTPIPGNSFVYNPVSTTNFTGVIDVTPNS